MARLRRAGHEGAALDGVSPASLGDFGLIPSPLGGEGQGEGSVTSLPGECRPRLNGTASPFRTRGRHPRQGFGFVPSPLAGEGQGEGVGNVIAWRLPPHASMAWLRRAGREDSVLDGVSPPLRGLASDFSLRGQRKVTKRKATPTCSPSCVGFPRLTRLSYGTRRWALTFAIHGVGQSPLRTSMSLRQTGPSVARPIPVWPMAQRRSLGVLPRGLDKRAHLGEQQGQNPTCCPKWDINNKVQLFQLFTNLYMYSGKYKCYLINQLHSSSYTLRNT